jgi:hypothetical protein
MTDEEREFIFNMRKRINEGYDPTVEEVHKTITLLYANEDAMRAKKYEPKKSNASKADLGKLFNFDDL